MNTVSILEKDGALDRQQKKVMIVSNNRRTVEIF
jgi:hypothetical protein